VAIYVIVALVVALIVFMLLKRGPSPYGLAKDAAEKGDIGELIRTAESLSPRKRFAFYQKAIAFLWEEWERPLAAQLVKEFSSRFPDEKISQFWMRRVMEVEPGVAKKLFNQRFLDDFYQPEVAQSCGLTSS